MPVWHEALKQQVADDQVTLVGVIQEQHPDRCRLFAQWHNIDWPILHDPINLIPTRAVPVIIAIDEHGVVQSTRPRLDWVKKEFLKTDYPAPEETTEPKFELTKLQRMVIWGDAVYQRALREGKDGSITAQYFDKAVAGYDAHLKSHPDDATAHFSRGVALRMRYESTRRQRDDFQAAVDAWGRALELDPNHYIYRRRIQQYGPRLIKPYPFYDWVGQARADIEKRGEKPLRLMVEPGGAEIARPSRAFEPAVAAVNPDPSARINRDKNNLIEVNSVAVPAMIKPGTTSRLHVELRPTAKAHWNNESEPVQVWIEQPDGWRLQKRLFALPQPEQAESTEVRRLEFEAKAPKNAKSTTLRGYALYYVCEEQNGTCLYLRRDFEIPVAVAD